MRKKRLLHYLLFGLLLSGAFLSSCEEEEPIKENNPPTVANGVIDLQLQAGFGEKEIAIGSVFADADQDELIITAKSSNTTVLTVEVDLNSLIITEVGSGESTITLTADDGNEGSISDSFKVTITEVEVNNAPMIQTALDDLSLESGFQSTTISLAEVFEDIDGDELTLVVSSGDETVATVALDGESLSISEVGEGTTTIEVKATDPDGESATDSFTLSISNSSPTVANTIADLTLSEGFSTHTIDLSSVFNDPTQEGLSYGASSSDKQVATVSINQSSLEISEVAGGTTTITVEAYNNIQKSASTQFTLTIEETVTSTDISITFGESTGNSITVSSWTTIDVAGYALVISDQESFSNLTDGYEPSASITYVGSGQQVLYLGTQTAEIEALLLGSMSDYYFKIFTYSGDYVWDATAHTAEIASTNDCSTSSTSISEVCFDYSVDDIRTITSNQYPSHAVGKFPNADPTAIEVSRSFDMSPSQATSVTYVYDETGGPTPKNQNFYQFGMAINGVEFHPMGLKPWTNPDTAEENWKWQEQVTEEGQTDLDAYGAHVTSQGNYHYHGDIVGLADEEDGSQHSQIYGFAGDGFPIYYKYGYIDQQTPSSGVKELKSSYQLKSGTRTDEGTAGTDYPDGSYDGTYIQDYEYVSGLGDLDECNGRWGITPEYPDGTYYYVITADFPVTPNCFRGTPDSDWIIGK